MQGEVLETSFLSPQVFTDQDLGLDKDTGRNLILFFQGHPIEKGGTGHIFLTATRW